MLPITNYQAIFKPSNNTYRIQVQIGNKPAITVPVNSIEQYNAFLIMLGREGVLYDEIANVIELPKRPVGT